MKEQTIFELIHAMDQVTNKLIIEWNRSFKENLSISHVLVLAHLKQNGKSRPSDIAKELGFTPPSLTHLSEKLVKNKLAIRVIDETDRRIIYLDITQKGIDIAMKANIEGNILRKKLFERISEEERLQLLKIYEKLIE